MVDVERTMQFPVLPDELWDVLIDPALFEEWFGATDVDLRPGGTLSAPGGDGGDAVRTAIVEEVDPGRRLTFTWAGNACEPGSRVELEVVECDDGSELRVRESLVEDELVSVPEPPFPIGFQPPSAPPSRGEVPRALARA